MPIRTSVLLCLLFCITATVAHGDDDANAAPQYFFAILELDQLPDHVTLATTDDPQQGFSSPLSQEQKAYLQQSGITRVLMRFDRATSLDECSWGRYSGSNWSGGNLNNSLHRLARVALLRARLHYETGQWISGNRDVERVRIMARHMSLQARFYEHQCFMVENMATGTAGAYLLMMPRMALDDLAEGHRRVGRFARMSPMLESEAQRIRTTADAFEEGRVTGTSLRFCIEPFLESSDAEALLQSPTQDVALQLRDFAMCIDGLSQLMTEDIHRIEESIRQLDERHAPRSRMAAGFNQWAIGEYRENAQALCRGFMFGSVIDQLRAGQRDFHNIDDPYGDENLKIEQEASGFRLVSSLRNQSEIDFRFGMAKSIPRSP